MDPMDVVVPEQEFLDKENKYNSAMRNNQMTDQIAFEYAWCLIKSHNALDIHRGIDILNNLCKKTEDRRDYMYYLGVGYTKLKDYKKAKEILNAMLKKEPTNTQVLSLLNTITKMEKKKSDEALIAGGAILAIGGIALLAFGVAKK